MNADPDAGPGPSERRLGLAACVFMLVGLTCSLIHLVSQKSWSFALFGTAGFASIGLGLLLYGGGVFRELRSRKVL